MPQKSIPIQVVTWNVNRRKADVLDTLKGLVDPDVLTLQEVMFSQRSAFEEHLGKMGLKCCPESQRHTRGRDYGNLIASRWKIDPVEPRYPRKKPAWHELLVQASVSVDGRSFLVINVHIPNGSGYGWKKIDTFNALKDVVRKAKGKPCIVAGDFNEPQLIPLQDRGRIVTWGQYWDGREGRFDCWEKWRFHRRTGEGKDWDAAVRWIFEKENEHGLRHAYWEAHERGGMPVSHVVRSQPRWFDHMFVSPDFRVEQCEYLHEVRLGRHSDHSALEAKLLLKA
jgi:endonuclease/exonuclease/phosphatase family metal-dependent hydrolase